jgi:ABC-type transporter Mla MlaB component
VSIFSLFGKKDGRTVVPAEKDASRRERQRTASPGETGKQRSRVGTPPTVKPDAQTARATTMKIDAIESEMSSEFGQAVTIQPHNTVIPPKSVQNGQAPQTLTAGMGTTTEFLLGGHTAIIEIAPPSSEAAAVIEEAAIMYANGQGELAEQMLRNAIEEDQLEDVTRNAWGMLFDLYQLTGKQEEFENLSIAYASKFETSPPAWTGGIQAQRSAAPPANATPTIRFTGKLDGAVEKQVERVRKLAENRHSVRLEFVRIAAVDPQACSLLLDLLKRLQKSGHDLILVGASELADGVRALLEVGRRDDTEDAWLLLLEILRLLNREQEFEEASIDYCVTFEVSPPAFTPPQNKVTTAATEAPPAAEGFMMPALIEGSVDSLIVRLIAYSDKHNPAIVDCSQLARIEFNAASRLLTGLAPFCSIGKSIEFHHVNRLVTELFNVIGLNDIVHIAPRKN